MAIECNVYPRCNKAQWFFFGLWNNINNRFMTYIKDMEIVINKDNESPYWQALKRKRYRSILMAYKWIWFMASQWRHNDRDRVSNHQPHDCLLNSLFRRRSKKTSKFRVTGLCEGNSLVTGEFPAQSASNAENVYISWRHHRIDMIAILEKLLCASLHLLNVKTYFNLFKFCNTRLHAEQLYMWNCVGIWSLVFKYKQLPYGEVDIKWA